MMRFVNAILFTFFIAGISGALASEKAELSLVVSDQDLDRLPGAAAIFRAWDDQAYDQFTTPKTDSLGKATQKILLPKGAPVGFDVEVRCDGYFSKKVLAVATPGANLTLEVTLEKKITTKLRFLEADGKLAAHRRFVMDSWHHLSTNDKGEHSFTHPKSKGASHVRFRNQTFRLKSGESVIEIQARSVPQISSQFSFAQVQNQYPSPADPVAKVTGKLLTPDGQPARGWLVAKQVYKGGGGMVISGGRIMPGSAQYQLYYQSLDEVADDGSFELKPAFEDLVIVSPSGMPFRYPLNPASWSDPSGLKETTITVPKIDKVKVSLRLKDEDGQPAVGYRAVASLGSSYDVWDLTPSRTDIPSHGFYADQALSPKLLDRLTAGPVSDKNGEISLPVHPWRQLRSIALHSPHKNRYYDGRWRWPVFGKMKNGDVVVYREAVDPVSRRSVDNQFTDFLITSFKDSDGKVIDPERVRWSLYLKARGIFTGKGGFVRSAKGHRFTISSGEGHLSFNYRNSRGVINTLRLPFDPTAPLPAELEIKLEREKEIVPSLSGIVLTADGKPAKDIRLHLMDPTATDSNKRYLQIIEVTNGSGEFKFLEAPSECGMTVAALRDGYQFSLDESIEVPKIDAKHRKIEIKMKPTGSVTVKLVDPKSLPDSLYLFEVDDLESPVKSYRHHLYQTRSDAFVYHTPYVPPGKYRLSYSQYFEPLGEEVFTVRANKESKLDVTLPEKLSAPREKPPTFPVTVTVTRDGKPAVGIVVKSDSIPAEPVEFEWGKHVINYIGDTTDQAGEAHFSENVGTNMIYVAMDHEQCIVWKTVEIGKKAIEVKLELGGDSPKTHSDRAHGIFRLPKK